ncbi:MULTISPECIES: DNA mismatch repair endonuclease MutL [unclassified Fusibacter]|uniref:DNA mismatch repair endonuclease MutL n=1 Tax=unclassified Fusibacter TaxID=2624464 RepID=UPI0010139A78|nr:MULTISPECIES: DNA mismatch repair endonuclease MutL [unclassified Fusibacter]MCK8058832.1 DNA mismatch repair endonuclease MutL [Fusibacter sp. A2]NPE21906.1 DNA mismatch repair endonuclease MutL [Fusibacter sp. A1]RXV61477.1 DNA mismatch repair endonuclease MutL [Fusibacter sp. A1]
MIRKLDPSISNKIAAGEVVERPAAVVKELVENSIDAGATAITIEIKDAGKSYIRISDNGSGIPYEELPLAFERHATSKIDSVEAIYKISTLGFRGEALASIASVSRVELVTKTKNDETGHKVTVNGGVLGSAEQIGTTDGTTLIIRDLFYNTPVRFKFLKSNQAEQSVIVDLVNKLALSHTEIRFTLIVDGREAYRTDGKAKLQNALMHIYGRELVRHMIPVEAKTDKYVISGFVSKPSYTRGNRKYQMLFVNGRYVKSDDIQKTVNNAYKGLTTIGKFGVYALAIETPFDHVDVNIHPSKTEIRFKEPLAIEGFLFTTIKHALMGVDLVPKVTLSDKVASVETTTSRISVENRPEPPVRTKESAVYIPDSVQVPVYQDSVKEPEAMLDMTITGDIMAKLDAALTDETFDDLVTDDLITDFFDTQPTPRTDEGEQVALDVTPVELSTLYDDLHVIGTLFSTYIICERGHSAFIVDQHAAHERVLYEQFISAFKEDRVESQMLLQAFVYEGDLASRADQEDAIRWLMRLGVTVEPFGEHAWVIRSVPVIKGVPLSQDTIQSLLDRFEEEKSETLNSHFAEDVIRASCRAAVKARDVLSLSEIQGLFSLLKTLENPYTCPHGRPIIIEMTEKEFEKKFKRIQ